MADLVKVGAGASGPINFEFSTQEYEELLLAVMGKADWTDLSHSDDGNISGQVLTMDTMPETDWISAGYVKLSGFTNPANNGVKRIVSVAGSAITFEAGSLVAEPSGLRTLMRRYATNGTYMDSFNIERAVLIDDAEYAYQHHAGMTCGGMALKIASMEMITGSFTFQGKIGAYANRSQSRNNEVAATGTLTLTGLPIANETVTIGTKIYTWKASVTTGANEVEIGGSMSDSLDNLIAAINGGSGSGTVYGSLTVAHTQVTAAAGVGETMVVTAIVTDVDGIDGNDIDTLETLTNGSWGAAELAGGVSADAYTAVSTEDVVNGTNNVVTIASGAGALSDPAKTMNFTINNNLRSKDKIGTEGAFEIGQGQFQVTGTLECYFESNAMFRQIVDHEDISLSILLEDSDGNMIGMTWPRVKLADGNPNTGGNNQDVMINPNFTACKDPVTGVTMILDTFPAS